MSEDPVGSALRFQARLPRHPLSPSAARGLVRALESCIDREVIERTELILSELVSNAVRHGSPQREDVVEVEVVASEGRLTGQIRDSGPPFRLDHDKPPGPDGGFGLNIAVQLSDTVDIRRVASGNEVSFSVGTDVSRLLTLY